MKSAWRQKELLQPVTPSANGADGVEWGGLADDFRGDRNLQSLVVHFSFPPPPFSPHP